MNSQLIRSLPMDMRREIYAYLPLQNCMICHGIVIIYGPKPSPMVCCMRCLYIFNQRMIGELALHRIAIPIFNMYVACNYVYIKCIIFLIFISLFLGYNLAAVYCITLSANIVGALWLFLV